MMATDVHPAIAELTGDGDTFELEDGRTLRLKVEPDDDSSIMDEQGEGVWCGRLAWVNRDRWTGHDAPRPDGFDGRARKLQRNSGDPIWWQPPEDLDADNIVAMSKTLLDLLEYGYCGVIVELCDGEDAYHRPIVVKTASLWGIEPFPDKDYLAEVVRELVEEVLS